MLSRDIRVDWRQFVTGLASPHGSLGTPILPVRQPGSESILLAVDALMKLPVKRKEPVKFHCVQFSNRNVADFGPRPVLEGVVVEELAAQK